MGGVLRPDDPIFLTQPIRASATITVTTTVPPPAAGETSYSLGGLTASCR